MQKCLWISTNLFLIRLPASSCVDTEAGTGGLFLEVKSCGLCIPGHLPLCQTDQMRWRGVGAPFLLGHYYYNQVQNNGYPVSSTFPNLVMLTDVFFTESWWPLYFLYSRFIQPKSSPIADKMCWYDTLQYNMSDQLCFTFQWLYDCWSCFICLNEIL